MAYIAPNGNIWLLHNVPIDKTYQNTLYWPRDEAHYHLTGKTNQKNYFIGTSSTPSTFVKKTYTNQYYTRYSKGSLRINDVADVLFDCNYLVFQNSSYGSGRYFYAFITGIEYINNAVTQVNFELDVIQTWYFDFKIEPCFLERTHTPTDTIGDNIVPENVDTGEYVNATGLVVNSNLPNSYYVIVAVSEVIGSSTVQGKMYGRIYGGTTLIAFPTTSTSGINSFLSDLVAAGKKDAVVSIYMIPTYLIKGTVTVADAGTTLAPGDIETDPFTISFSNVSDQQPLVADFTPHNKKLYTYPYTYFNVQTPTGGKLILRYEFFKTVPKVSVGGSVTQPVQVVLMAKEYKQQLKTGDTTLLTESLENSIVLDSFPSCSWTNDAYAAWVAQNSIPATIDVMSSGLSAILSAVASPVGGNVVGGVLNVVNTITGVVKAGYQASIAGDKLNGKMDGSPSLSMGKQTFWFSRVSVDESTARIIDSYFDRFGYAIKKINTVNRKNRKYFTYIKTIGCTLNGSMPSDAEELVCKIHDEGITYWDSSQLSNNQQVGDFSLASGNTPTGGAE